MRIFGREQIGVNFGAENKNACPKWGRQWRQWRGYYSIIWHGERKSRQLRGMNFINKSGAGSTPAPQASGARFTVSHRET
jgi:hypothetical protein